MNERLCIKEVGVDLELCVHAHGPDVELIMKASCKYLIIWAILPVSLNWIPCNYGSDHIVLL